jgi:hypothetical protein
MEAEMNTNRVIAGLIVAAVATIAALTGREAIAIESTNRPSNYYAGADFAQRHPEVGHPSAARLEQLAAIKDGNAAPASGPVRASAARLDQLAAIKDGSPAYVSGTVGASAARLDQLAAIKDGGLAAAASLGDLSDYALRHPELSHVVAPVDLSDFYLRHPDWINTSAGVNLEDYALRHPGQTGLQP